MTPPQSPPAPSDLHRPAVATTETDEAKERREAVFRKCTRFLFGHGLADPRAALAAALAEAGADERPDFYGSGPVLSDFEAHVAKLLGKPAAVFMPSGTMAQQIALRIFCDRNGCSTVGFHPTSHLHIHERQALSHLHGMRSCPIGIRQELISLADLHSVHEPLAALLLELPQREIGGQLPAWDELCAQVAWARERQVAVHLDGARLWEAQPYYQRSHADISALFDTVYVSFYKGVGAIAGAILAGPSDIIAEARVWLRRHGGNLIHLYPYVLSARAALRERLPRFAEYCARARQYADALRPIPGVAIVPDPPQTPMMHLYLSGTQEAILQASEDVAADTGTCLVRRLRPADAPGTCVLEFTVGDGSAELPPAELGALFARLMAAARAR